jgi:hypothetical protein
MRGNDGMVGLGRGFVGLGVTLPQTPPTPGMRISLPRTRLSQKHGFVRNTWIAVAA